MRVSIEIPVIKGGWLRPCIESVLSQTSPNWRLYLLWDGGDDLSKEILEEMQRKNHPQITIFFKERMGIANARRYLTEHSEGDFLLPVDDDDILAPEAVEKLLDAAERMPWSGIIRSDRGYIDEDGNIIDMEPWFPFQSRKYVYGMTTDLFNQTHPYLIRRSIYNKTSGWEGFKEYMFAGEDCDIFLKIEEHAEIELIKDCLYYYRINPQRTSNKIGNPAAYDMWQRLADRTIKRRGLPLERVNDEQPFQFKRLDTPRPSKEMVDVVVPFWESDEEEVHYEFSRPSQFLEGVCYPVSGDTVFRQLLEPPLPPFDRFELTCSSQNPISGTIVVSAYADKRSASPSAVSEFQVENAHMICKFISMELGRKDQNKEDFRRLEVAFHPESDAKDVLIVHAWRKTKRRFWQRNSPHLWMRLFRNHPGYARQRLELCLRSLKKAGISDDSIFVIEKQQSSAVNRNEGISLSTKPFICFMDDDVEIISPDLFEVLLEKLHSMKVDMVGPKIVTDTGMIFCADPFFNEQLMPNPRGLGEFDNSQYDYSSMVPWLPSTFLIMRRGICQSVGGLDENYVGSQHEDVDFCLKARARGFQLSYVGEVAVKHYNCSRNNSHSANFKYFQRRWEKHKDLFASSGMKRTS